MTEDRSDKTHERKMELPVDDNLMELVDELRADDDEIIDLVEESDSLSESDDDIIELEEKAQGDLTDGAELIDLVEETKALNGAFDEIIDLEEESGSRSESDEEIIELEVAEKKDLMDDEELIDLVEEAEEAPLDLLEESTSAAADEAYAIDLVEATDDGDPSPPEASLPSQPEEAVIDLVYDDSEERALRRHASLSPEDGAGETDTDLIELDLETGERGKESLAEDEGIIDLADAVEEASSVAEKVILIRKNDQGEASSHSDAEAAHDSGLSLPPGLEITDPQIDAALERVIKKMFAERIDGLLTTIIDRTIIRELKALQDKLSGK